MSLVRFRDHLRVYSQLLQTLVFQAEILVAHVPLGSWLFGKMCAIGRVNGKWKTNYYTGRALAVKSSFWEKWWIQYRGYSVTITIPEDSKDKEQILDLNNDGHISVGESIRAEAGLLEEFTKEPAKAKGLKGWINRLLGRGLGKIDNR